RLRHGIGGPIGTRGLRHARGHEDHTSGIGTAQQRIKRADQAPVGGYVDVEDALPVLGWDVRQRRQRAEDGGAADEDIESAEALIEGWGESIDRPPVGEIERDQARGAAGGSDVVIDTPEIGHATGQKQRVRAFTGVGKCDRPAEPTRGTGNERNAILETLALDQPTSARKESCFCCGGPSRSLSRVGYSPVKQWSVNCGWAESRPS